ncbi:Protein CBG26224 [Caenorhabditis briggsae]|uniref:Protein CBG26224 n=1 Tax=Caenorhabditis briggsae TaxID=6238 RepID=B6IEN2_CAEBR|nr:Protein CBG26224 [Caenorhabditis briggsae]CAR98362.1 Protein CBG26224 [Caenorhabditis briggsae]
MSPSELRKMSPKFREPEEPTAKELGRRVVTLKCDEDAIFPSSVTKYTHKESGSKDGVKERLKATEVARSQAPIVFHRTEGECDICGQFLTDGLELVEVWSRRILLYMLFKAKTIKRDRCKRIYNTTEQLVVCREHVKQAIEEVFETFGTQHPSQFLSMFQDPTHKPIINRMYEDLCRVYDLWYENRDTLIRAARSFVLSCEKGPATEVPNQTNCLKTPTYSTRSRPNTET